MRHSVLGGWSGEVNTKEEESERNDFDEINNFESVERREIMDPCARNVARMRKKKERRWKSCLNREDTRQNVDSSRASEYKFGKLRNSRRIENVVFYWSTLPPLPPPLHLLLLLLLLCNVHTMNRSRNSFLAFNFPFGKEEDRRQSTRRGRCARHKVARHKVTSVSTANITAEGEGGGGGRAKIMVEIQIRFT